MILGTFIKQPTERFDYDITYKDWLTSGDNLESVVVTPDDVTISVDFVIVNDPICKIWVSGGENGKTYKLTVTATTADGRVKQDEFKVKVKDI